MQKGHPLNEVHNYSIATFVYRRLNYRILPLVQIYPHPYLLVKSFLEIHHQ